MSGPRTTPFIIFIAVSILLLGCATTVRNPSKSDVEAIAGGERSIVLLRLSAEIRSQSGSQRTEGPERFKSRIASIDTRQSPKDIFLYDSPSSEAQKDGWVYFMLEPGTYYLSVSPTPNTWPEYFSPNFFWFHVSKGNQIIYIGTLTTACETSGDSCFSRIISVWSKVRVIDQTESAIVIAQASFSRFAPMSSAILKPLGIPKTTRTIDELVPMGFMTTSAKSLISPDWNKRAISRATGIGDWLSSGANSSPQFLDDHPFLGECLKGAGEGAAPLLVLLYLYYLPAGITGGTIAGEVAEHKWQHTTQGLQQELHENDPATLLGSAFETMISQYGASRPINLNQADDPFAQAKQQGLKSIFQTEILKIELSECVNRGSFCVAVTLRTRLWETASKTLLYDLVSQYSNAALRRKKTLFYETEVTEVKGEGTECRKMEAYGGAEGRKLLTEEISKAIQASMQRFFDDVVKKKSQ